MCVHYVQNIGYQHPMISEWSDDVLFNAVSKNFSRRCRNLLQQYNMTSTALRKKNSNRLLGSVNDLPNEC